MLKTEVRRLTFRFPSGQDYIIEVPKEDDEYWWTEGNGGCDCNRLLEIDRQYPEAHVLESGEGAMCGNTIRLVEVDPKWEINEDWGV